MVVVLPTEPCSVAGGKDDYIHDSAILRFLIIDLFGKIVDKSCYEHVIYGLVNTCLVLDSTIGTPLLDGALGPWGVSTRAICTFDVYTM